MAFDNTEIEIKIRLDSNDVDELKKKLNKLGKHISNSFQKDTYYVPSFEDYLEERFPYKWFSIRERDGKKILNFKHFYPEKAEKHTHCDEYETELSSGENVKKILSELGIVEKIVVEKKRDNYLVDDYEIVIDEVAELGFFLEIEATKNTGSPEKIKNDMIDFLRGIGITQMNVDYRGYPFLLIERAKKK